MEGGRALSEEHLERETVHLLASFSKSTFSKVNIGRFFQRQHCKVCTAKRPPLVQLKGLRRGCRESTLNSGQLVATGGCTPTNAEPLPPIPRIFTCAQSWIHSSQTRNGSNAPLTNLAGHKAATRAVPHMWLRQTPESARRRVLSRGGLHPRAHLAGKSQGWVGPCPSRSRCSADPSPSAPSPSGGSASC